MLLNQTKATLSPKDFGNIGNFEGLGLILIAYKKKKCENTASQQQVTSRRCSVAYCFTQRFFKFISSQKQSLEMFFLKKTVLGNFIKLTGKTL